MSQIRSIELPDSFDVYKGLDGASINFLQPISKINILVGSNNSGKSRFMRLLSAQTEYKVLLREVDLAQINFNIVRVLDELKNAMERSGIAQANDLNIETIEKLQLLPSSISMSMDSYQDIRNIFSKWRNFPDVSSWTMRRDRNHVSEVDRLWLRDAIRSLSNDITHELNQIPVHSSVNALKKVYIPILRGLRTLDEQHTDLYAQRTQGDYFSSRYQSSPDIFTGLSFYQHLMQMLLGDNSSRKIISNYQDFISQTLFEGRSVALIPNINTKVVTVKIGKEKEQPIFNLGDGIQTAIILSFLPFTTKEPTFFFIEEPELHLHPGLQRKVVELFASREEHTFFLTTHSNHFLDITIDVKDSSVFTFRKQLNIDDDNDEQTPTFAIETVDTGNSSSLELLGVRNSSVFLVNATIWIEGITDRWYLRTMLNSYMKHLSQTNNLSLRLEEDVHYSFVEYGGANITHWSFLDYEDHPIEVERLCARAIVVVDKDGDAKLKRKEDLERTLGDRLIVLPGREVENMLPFIAIKEVVLEYEGTLDRHLPDIPYEEYQDRYLGEFIQNVVLEGNYCRRGGYCGKSGTIKSKVDFCERIIGRIEYSNLPLNMQEVIKKIYNFIYSQNT